MEHYKYHADDDDEQWQRRYADDIAEQQALEALQRDIDAERLRKQEQA
jgi:hypothetical protein